MFRVALFILSLSCTQSEVRDFEWLLGKWKRIDGNPSQELFEMWKKSSDVNYSGLAFNLDGKDTVVQEVLHLSHVDGTWYYIAEVAHNDKPTEFEMVAQSDRYFRCENPHHDFPKIIEYTQVNDTMRVTIADEQKTIPFTFIRLE